MIDDFAKLIGPFIDTMIQFQHQFTWDKATHPPIARVKAELREALDLAGQQASHSAKLAAEFDEARAALVYWADETLINSPWIHANAWKNHILEQDIYMERLRSDRFFERADQAQKRDRTDVLETYLACVLMGFRGRYADDPTGLREWLDQVKMRVAASARAPEKPFPDDPPAQPILAPLPGKGRLLSVSLLVALTALGTLAGYLLAVWISD